MRNLTKIVLTGTAILQLATLGALGATTYQLDNGHVNYILNASDGTEPLDNWFGNEFTATAGGNLINGVDMGVGTFAPGTTATLALYTVGNPAIGATLLYTQPFALAGPGTNFNMQHISLSTPQLINVGEQFLVSVLIRNVIGLPPNDVYPFAADTSTSSLGSFWDRSAPGAFNLNNLDAAMLMSYGLAPDGSGAPPFIPGGHVILRADGIAVPEPTTFALAGIGAAALLIYRRRSR